MVCLVRHRSRTTRDGSGVHVGNFSNHVIVLNEIRLRRPLRAYVDYYNADRVHTQLQDSLLGRPADHQPTPEVKVFGWPRVGGFRHRGECEEAA